MHFGIVATAYVLLGLLAAGASAIPVGKPSHTTAVKKANLTKYSTFIMTPDSIQHIDLLAHDSPSKIEGLPFITISYDFPSNAGLPEAPDDAQHLSGDAYGKITTSMFLIHLSQIAHKDTYVIHYKQKLTTWAAFPKERGFNFNADINYVGEVLDLENEHEVATAIHRGQVSPCSAECRNPSGGLEIARKWITFDLLAKSESLVEHKPLVEHNALVENNPGLEHNSWVKHKPLIEHKPLAEYKPLAEPDRDVFAGREGLAELLSSPVYMSLFESKAASTEEKSTEESSEGSSEGSRERSREGSRERSREASTEAPKEEEEAKEKEEEEEEEEEAKEEVKPKPLSLDDYRHYLRVALFIAPSVFPRGPSGLIQKRVSTVEDKKTPLLVLVFPMRLPDIVTRHSWVIREGILNWERIILMLATGSTKDRDHEKRWLEEKAYSVTSPNALAKHTAVVLSTFLTCSLFASFLDKLVARHCRFQVSDGMKGTEL
ncbi:hypothetical protein EV360DRAFT_73348 [Lentinula raphanica]|nr:hypothetical protein EV360DRAFT_73348 [Lentinula raphanica]